MTQAQTKPHSKPLRDLLRGAIEQRKASLRNNRCHLRNTEQIWVSISHAEKWMGHFPFAGDDSVRDWCVANRHHVCRIVPGNAKDSLAKLVGATLRIA